MVTTVLFSLGSLVLVLALVSFVSADRVESFIGRDPLAETTTSAAPLVFLFALAVSLLIAAPITEELVFRGVMLHRFAVKWGLGPAIVVSSVLFGLLHQFNFVGAAAFGLVMSLLYVRTRTLIVPIACHVLSNAVVVFVVVVRELTGGTGEEESNFTADQVRDEVVVGVALVLLTAPILARFVYKNWPRLGVGPPYFS